MDTNNLQNDHDNTFNNGIEYHCLSIEETFTNLNTCEKGISNNEAEIRLDTFGFNELVEETKTTPLEIFLNQFKSILIVILVIAAGVSGFFLQEYTDMVFILLIVVLNAVIGFIQEYRAEKAVEALKKMVSPICKVIRDGNIKEISANTVVPGDILVIQDGDKIPADGRLIEVHNLKIDESSLTGESTTVSKINRDYRRRCSSGSEN